LFRVPWKLHSSTNQTTGNESSDLFPYVCSLVVNRYQVRYLAGATYFLLALSSPTVHPRTQPSQPTVAYCTTYGIWYQYWNIYHQVRTYRTVPSDLFLSTCWFTGGEPLPGTYLVQYLPYRCNLVLLALSTVQYVHPRTQPSQPTVAYCTTYRLVPVLLEHLPQAGNESSDLFPFRLSLATITSASSAGW
jgi:hypothetical protein